MKLILVILIMASFQASLFAGNDAFYFQYNKAKNLCTEDPEKSIAILDEILIKKLDMGQQEMINLNILYAECNKALSEFKKANGYLIKALKEKPNAQTKADIYFLLAINHYYLASFDQTIFYSTEILKLSDKVSLLIRTKAESLLGSAYAQIENFKQAKKFIYRSALHYKKLGQMQGYGKALINYSDIYQREKNFEEAIHCCQKGLKHIEKSDGAYLIAVSNIGVFYRELKQYDSALVYLNEALVICQNTGDISGELVVINNLANIYQDRNQMQAALKYYLKAEKMAEEIGDRRAQKDILFNISAVYNELGQTEKSYRYFKAYVNLKEQLFSEDNARFVVETEEKYKASKREAEIAELKVKKQQEETKSLAIKYWLLIVLILTVLVVVIIIWVYRGKMLRLRTNQDKAITIAALESEEKERLRISQEIHDDLGGVLGMSRMLFSRAKKLLIDQDKELYQRIDQLLLEANNRSRAISHELFSPTLKEFGIVKALEELTSQVGVARPELKVSFNCEDHDLKLDDQISLNLYRIVQELINNTCKYAQASELTLALKTEGKVIHLNYQDNGIGVDLASGKTGVGLKSIQSRVGRINGKLKFESTPGSGFKTFIQVEKLAS